MRKRWCDLADIDLEPLTTQSGWYFESVEGDGLRACPSPSAGVDMLLIFDGGAIGNPGKGYGSFVFSGVATGGPIRISFPGLTTNNVAEYQTLIGALQTVLLQLESTGQDPAKLTIEVRSDSQLLVNQLTGLWKVRNANLRKLHDTADELLKRFGEVRLHWQRRKLTQEILGH